MANKVIGAAGFEVKKYFFEPEFSGLPAQVQNEIKEICVSMAEKLGCTFITGFSEDGGVYFETVAPDAGFDEIGAELEIKRIRTERAELINSLALWYAYKNRL